MLDWLFKENAPKDEKDFVSLSSHELRTPLSVIKWYTEMLLDGDAGPLTEDQKKYLTTIQSSNQQAIDLVRSLLNVSRLDLGTFGIAPTDIDLKELINEALFSEEYLRVKKQIHIEKEGWDNSFIIKTDKKMALLALKNVLANAFIFSSASGVVTISLSTVSSDQELNGKEIKSKGVIVKVIDHGIGIPDDEQNLIFTKMHKGKNAKDVDSPGSGLGLYITREIMKNLNGEVWFTSDQGTTTFCLFFPSGGVLKKEGRTTLD